jgi:four helix bundle protein
MVANEINSSKGVEAFEDLYIFKEARKLTSNIWRITRGQPFSRDQVLVNQVRRAALSIASNIAEGFERQSDKDFARFLVIAKGSCGEVRAQLLIAMDQQYITKEQYSDLSGEARQISAGLANLARYLQNSAPDKRRSSTG